MLKMEWFTDLQDISFDPSSLYEEHNQETRRSLGFGKAIKKEAEEGRSMGWSEHVWFEELH